tara:strand:+ start:209 stop:604 length:396 start_codon:yes stop_codon:yes gene_type:complete
MAPGQRRNSEHTDNEGDDVPLFRLNDILEPRAGSANMAYYPYSSSPFEGHALFVSRNGAKLVEASIKSRKVLAWEGLHSCKIAGNPPAGFKHIAALRCTGEVVEEVRGDSDSWPLRHPKRLPNHSVRSSKE